MSNVYCDRFADAPKGLQSRPPGCRGIYVDAGAGTPTDDQLRVRGWHVWRGALHSGFYTEVRLCPQCTGSTRTVVPQVLEGQQELFEVEEVEPSHRMP